MFGRSKDGNSAVMERMEEAAEEAAASARRAAEEMQEAAEEVSRSRGGRRLMSILAIGVLAALVVVWRSR
jgi:hypothetical protein